MIMVTGSKAALESGRKRREYLIVKTKERYIKHKEEIIKADKERTAYKKKRIKQWVKTTKCRDIDFICAMIKILFKK